MIRLAYKAIQKYNLARNFISNIFLLIYFYLRIKKFLDQKNITDYKIFDFKSWHHGYAYFIAIQSNKKVFIKIDTKLLLLENDLTVYELAKNSEIKKNLVEILDFIKNKNFQVIIFEYLEGEKLTKQHLLKNIELVKEIEKILKNLNKLGIIHRDIRLDNFLVVNKNLKIIDFTFAVSCNDNLKLKDLDLSKKKNCEILEGLGADLNPTLFVWNDFYAFKKMLLSIDDKGFFAEYINNLQTIQAKYYVCEPKSWFYCFIKNLKKKIKNFLRIEKVKDCTDIFHEIAKFRKC